MYTHTLLIYRIQPYECFDISRMPAYKWGEIVIGERKEVKSGGFEQGPDHKSLVMETHLGFNGVE